MGQGIPTTEELRALGLEGAVETLQAQIAALRAEVEAQREAMGHASNALEQKEREIGLLRAEVGRLRVGLGVLWRLEAYPSPFYKQVKEMIHFFLHGVDSEGCGQTAADDVAHALSGKEIGG